MADIFISYARADRERVAALAAALEAAGYSVWWDQDIDAGSEFSRDIEAELLAAGAVLVCWSREGSASRWVRDEAGLAAEKGSLVAASLDGALPPLGFRQYHVAALDHWSGGQPLPPELLRAIANRSGDAGGAPSTPPTTAPVEPRPAMLRIGLAALLAVLLAGLLWWQTRSDGPDDAAAEMQQASIAVLPFEALSDDEDDQYFGRGIAEELLNALAKFPDLKVAGRSSSFSFEGSDAPGNEIGDQLGVEHLLEGSVRRAGDRIRVTATLTSARSGEQLWAQTYEREITDIFAIQDEIVAELARVLQFRLGVGAGAGRADRQDVDPRAYEAYLRGLDSWWQRHRRDNRYAAVRAFHEATRLDPDFAEAWSAFGMGLALSGGAYFNSWGPEFSIAAGDEALRRALELDPDNVRANAVLASWRNDPTIASRHLKKALDAAPSDAFANYSAGLHHAWVGDLEEAVRYFDLALRLDPLNRTVRRIRALTLSGMDRFEEVEQVFEESATCEAAACAPDNVIMAANGMTAALHSASHDRLRKWRGLLRNARRHADLPDPSSRYWMDWLDRYTGHVLGEEQEFRASIPEDHDLVVGVGAALPAVMLARGGSMDRALSVLEDGFDNRDVFGPADDYALLAGRFEVPEAMRRHPRYHALWARPDFAALAKARRANGRTAGLPLPPAQ